MDYNETVGYFRTTSNIKYNYIIHLQQKECCTYMGTNVYSDNFKSYFDEKYSSLRKNLHIRTLIEFETFLKILKITICIYVTGTEKSQSVLWPYY